MAEVGLATSRRTRTGASYVNCKGRSNNVPARRGVSVREWCRRSAIMSA